MAKLPAIELAAPLTLFFLLASPAAQADIKVQPAIEARETYTDNVSLSSDNNNSSGQFVTELMPSLRLLSNGPRLKLSVRATGHLFAYSGERPGGTNSSTLDVTGNGKATVVSDFFYVDGSFNRTRQSVSPFGPQFQNNYSNSNSDTITTYSISPYLMHRFGSFADAQLRLTHDGVDGQQVSQYNSTGNSIALTLNSGPRFTRFGWQLQAYHQDLDDLVAGKSTVDTILATLRYRVREDFSVYTNQGYDKYEYPGVGGTSKGKNYSAGFTWTPSSRTSIDASAGHRYFGRTYSLAATHRSRNTVWVARYNDDVSTARAQFLRPGSIDTAAILDSSFASAFPDPVARRQAIEAYLRANGLPLTVANNVNYFSNRLFLQKQAAASVVVNGSRSSLILSANNTRRQALSPSGVDATLPGDIALNAGDNTSQRSLSAAFTYRLSPRSSASAMATRAHVLSLDTGIDQTQTLYSFVITKQFERKLSGAIELRHNTGSSLAQLGGYSENAISARLSYSL